MARVWEFDGPSHRLRAMRWLSFKRFCFACDPCCFLAKHLDRRRGQGFNLSEGAVMDTRQNRCLAVKQGPSILGSKLTGACLWLADVGAFPHGLDDRHGVGNAHILYDDSSSGHPPRPTTAPR